MQNPRDIQRSFVTQCAPVLAGLKVANLFRWVEPDTEDFRAVAARWRRELNPKGVEVRIVKACKAAPAYLIYVYRPRRLAEILAKPEVRTYLQDCGYTPAKTPGGWLAQLSDRLCCEGGFPHEIGVFLGYPLGDVIGFVANKGKNYTCCGYWKTYGDPTDARRCFARYRKCTEVYLRCYASGTPLARLAVAG